MTNRKETEEVSVRVAPKMKTPLKKIPTPVLTMHPRRERTPLRLAFSTPKVLSRAEGQAIAALAAVVAVVMIAQGSIRSEPPALTAHVTESGRAEMGLEHAKPVTLSIALTVNGPRGVADIRHDALETVRVSLPSTWVRREVKGAPLSAVTAEDATFGFARWHIPPGVLISFDIAPPASLVLHHPSSIPAEIELTRVDLAQGSVERDIVLVQEGSQVLW